MNKPASKKKLQQAFKDGKVIKTKYLPNIVSVIVCSLILIFIMSYSDKNYTKIGTFHEILLILQRLVSLVFGLLTLKILIVLVVRYLESGFIPVFRLNFNPLTFLATIFKNIKFELIKHTTCFFWLILVVFQVIKEFYWEKTVAILSLMLITGLGVLERFFIAGRFYKELEMTDVEQKQEAKESGIHPEIRSHMNRVNKSLSREQAVSTATFIVVVRKSL